MGIDSTYEIHVGRSSSRSGPYLDKEGVEMTNGGGDSDHHRENHHHVPHDLSLLSSPMVIHHPVVRRILGVEEEGPVHRTRSCSHLPREWTVSNEHGHYHHD